jgi:RimJ/RimL family protein N-acetyltransferase
VWHNPAQYIPNCHSSLHPRRARGHGAGRALLEHLAQIAVERNWGRFEWAVLDWNEPSINFYKKMGARAMDEWTIFRMTGESLKKLALADSQIRRLPD